MEPCIYNDVKVDQIIHLAIMCHYVMEEGHQRFGVRSHDCDCVEILTS